MHEPRPSSSTAPSACAPLVRWLVPGDTLGRYVLVDEIGQGGMGVVFAARDPRLERDVALKVIRADVGDGSYRARVMREAQSLARLSHPNVVPVFDVGIDLGVVWVAMQRVRGPTLAAWLTERPPWSAVLDAFIEAGRGLAAAHAAGLVHRDFKPGNAMFDADGRVLVLDFGLAWAPQPMSVPSGDGRDQTAPTPRMRSASGRDPLGLTLTATGAVVGTPAYMAPEQHTGHEVDARSDQYALCLSIYEGVFGRRPFTGDLERLVAAKRTGPPPRPTDTGQHPLPERLWRVIERGLQPDPAARWPDVPSLLDALARERRPKRRWPVAIAAGAAISLGTIAAGDGDGVDHCAGADALDATWNDARRDRLADAFATLGAAKDASWPRVQSRIERSVAAWRDAATRACATPPDLAIVACVEDAAFALDETLDVLESAEPTRAARAVRILDAMASTYRCDGSGTLTPQLDDAMRRRYERGRALMAAGALAEAAEHARGMLAEAQDAQDQVAVAWALLQQGGAEMDDGRRDAADQHLQDALWTATAAGDDLAMTTAAIKLVHLCAYRFDTECAQPWLRNAEAGLARLGERGEQSARELELARGDVALRAAAFDEALDHYGRALESARAAAGDHEIFESVVLHAIGAAQASAGRHEAALASFAEADAIEARELGQGDTARSITLELSAGSLYALGRIPEARAALEEGLANLDAAYGADHPHAIRARGNLVLVLLDGGELDGALHLAQEVVALKRKAFGPEDVQVAIGLYNEGTVHSRMGDHRLALQRYDESLALWGRHSGPDHLDLAHPLSGQANALVELGLPEQAVIAGARAQALFEAHHVDVPGELLFDLGRAAWARGEHDAARDLVRRAIEAMPPEPRPGHPGRTELEAWSRAHAS